MAGIYSGGNIIARFVAPMSVISNKPIFTSDTLSLKRNAVSRSAQRWEITTNVEPLTTTANDLFALLVMNGFTTPITIHTPQNYGVMFNRVLKVSSPLGTGVQGATTVTVTGNSSSEFWPIGTLVKFASDTKIYMLTAPLTGNGTAFVFPPLRTTFTSQVIKYADDVPMQVYFDTDTIIGMGYVDGILMDNGTLKFVEAV